MKPILSLNIDPLKSMFNPPLVITTAPAENDGVQFVEGPQAERELLPICSSCKKIRDPRGYWHQLEVYFQKQFQNLGFSHSFCPECVRRLYPEIFAEEVHGGG